MTPPTQAWPGTERREVLTNKGQAEGVTSCQAPIGCFFSKETHDTRRTGHVLVFCVFCVFCVFFARPRLVQAGEVAEVAMEGGGRSVEAVEVMEAVVEVAEAVAVVAAESMAAVTEA